MRTLRLFLVGTVIASAACGALWWVVMTAGTCVEAYPHATLPSNGRR